MSEKKSSEQTVDESAVKGMKAMLQLIGRERSLNSMPNAIAAHVVINRQDLSVVMSRYASTMEVSGFTQCEIESTLAKAADLIEKMA